MTKVSGAPIAGWDAVDEHLTAALEQLRRALRVPDASLPATLHAVATEAVRTVDGAQYSGVNLLTRNVFTPLAIHGVPPETLDALQKATGIGPCIESSRDQTVVFSTSMATENRWDGFAELAVRLGVQSILCVPLWVDDTQLGSLSLYGTTEGAFDGRDELVARLFALHAATAIADAQRVENLQAALRSRDLIGQAKGILMERRRMTSDQAFAVLAQTSQRTNRKLVQVAETFVLTGELA